MKTYALMQNGQFVGFVKADPEFLGWLRAVRLDMTYMRVLPGAERLFRRQP